jgi:hypothetical protein
MEFFSECMKFGVTEFSSKESPETTLQEKRNKAVFAP